MRKLLVLAAVVAAVAASVVCADVKPNPIFSDNVVLQRSTVIPVWGTADSGERVTVEFCSQTRSTVAQNGKWMVRLRPLKGGGPFNMTIRGKNSIEIKNVLVGEVWVASGQSNMQWPLSHTENAEADIAASADPMLRLGTVPRDPSFTARGEAAVTWAVCGPETSPSFSSVAYFFGRELRRRLGCPVGLINSSWGGTRVEAWMSVDALKPFEIAYKPAKNKPGEAINPNEASVLYNGMIAPLLPFPIAGCIWYQGESNAGRAYQYHDLFTTMITDWRKAWDNPDMPFLFVQLAPYGKTPAQPSGSNWAELREAQLMTTKTLPNTAMAVITDCGEADNIHPKRKQPVGERLARAAMALAYEQDVVYKGPGYRSITIRGDRAILEFDDLGGGMYAKGDYLTGFTIAGADQKFHDARATIQGSRVVVSSPDVPNPVAVRYGWSDCPVVNLFSRSGLPASPFRTDDFPRITGPRPNAAGT